MKNNNADGLRGIAALNVTICHFFAAFLPAVLYKNYPGLGGNIDEGSIYFNLFASPILTIFYNGHFAVLVFFVLSGYVLAKPYFEGGDYKDRIKLRLISRYLRLNIPIIAALLFAYILLQSELFFNIEASDLSKSLWLSNFYSQSVSLFEFIKIALYKGVILGDGNLIPPLWTLKIEFIGSIFILCFYLFVNKRFFVPMIFLSMVAIYFYFSKDFIYYLSFFLGSLIGLYKVRGVLLWIFFIVGVYFGAFQFQSDTFDFLYRFEMNEWLLTDKKTMYNTIGAVFLSFAVINGFANKFFSNRLSRFLGRISYSMYLLHFPILCSLSAYFYIYLPLNFNYLLLNFFIYIFVCLGISFVFSIIIDDFSIRISKLFSLKVIGFKLRLLKKFHY